MSSAKELPDIVKEEWDAAADKAKVGAASVGTMAGQAVSAIGSLAGNVASDAGRMASDAASGAGKMVSQAAVDVGQKANELTASAGSGIKDLGERLGRNTPHDGVLGSASQAVARTVRDGGAYLEEARLSGVTSDLAQVIRRNPIPSVLIAIGLGWFVARRLRS